MGSSNKLNEKFLKDLHNHKTPVSVYLMNGIKLNGTIEDFDEDHIMLHSANTQLIFQHAVSTIVPNKSAM
jgi:host factor-I protein